MIRELTTIYPSAKNDNEYWAVADEDEHFWGPSEGR